MIMTFGDAIRTGFANYFNFAERAVPSEFWYWVLFTILVSIVTAIVDAIWFPDFYPISPLTDLFGLATLLPGLAVSVRRLHDTNRSGWWILLWFIPLIGIIVLIVWWVQQGTPGRTGSAQISPTPALRRCELTHHSHRAFFAAFLADFLPDVLAFLATFLAALRTFFTAGFVIGTK
jgi:uncharacterized membrane protein YhaH (DUF805 family)